MNGVMIRAVVGTQVIVVDVDHPLVIIHALNVEKEVDLPPMRKVPKY